MNDIDIMSLKEPECYKGTFSWKNLGEKCRKWQLLNNMAKCDVSNFNKQ